MGGERLKSDISMPDTSTHGPRRDSPYIQIKVNNRALCAPFHLNHLFIKLLEGARLPIYRAPSRPFTPLGASAPPEWPFGHSKKVVYVVKVVVFNNNHCFLKVIDDQESENKRTIVMPHTKIAFTSCCKTSDL